MQQAISWMIADCGVDGLVVCFTSLRCTLQVWDWLSDGITEAMLCAGKNPDKTVCRGDSGGPLSVEVGEQYLLIGDVSFVKSYHIYMQCEGNYEVFGNVAFFRDWIDETMNTNGGAQFCSSEPLTSTASATKEKTIKTLFFLFLFIYRLQWKYTNLVFGVTAGVGDVHVIWVHIIIHLIRWGVDQHFISLLNTHQVSNQLKRKVWKNADFRNRVYSLATTSIVQKCWLLGSFLDCHHATESSKS